MFELAFICPQEQVETLSDALEVLDVLSVSVDDADAHTDAEQALFGEPGMPAPKDGWQRSRVVGLFALESLAQDALRLLIVQDFFSGIQVIGVTVVPDQDWVRLTQSQFSPVEITPEFWIVPTWHQPPAAARTVIRLDPGLAFGTGTHPTTRMCLRWIAQFGAEVDDCKRLHWGPVLDYGCGSGILAIAAAKYGATRVDAIDIDPAAVASTLANASTNDVMVSCGLPDRADEEHYHVVLANILATPLKLLAPLLCEKVQLGGFLVLAGILERQTQELLVAFRPYLSLKVSDAEDGWVLLTARR